MIFYYLKEQLLSFNLSIEPFCHNNIPAQTAPVGRGMKSIKAIKEECFCHARSYCSWLTVTELTAAELDCTEHLKTSGQLLLSYSYQNQHTFQFGYCTIKTKHEGKKKKKLC